MNLFKRPRKVKFPAHEGSQTYARNRRPTTILEPGQTPAIPGQRSADQRAADYLNAIPDVDDKQWDPMPPPTTTHMEVWDLERSFKQKMADEAEPTMWIPVIQHRSESSLKDDQHGWDPLFPPETLALFERIRSRNIKEHGTPRARVVKRDGYWISIVYGSDGAAVLYDEVSIGPSQGWLGRGGWELMMRSASSDLVTVRRIEAAGHRLPEAENPTHY